MKTWMLITLIILGAVALLLILMLLPLRFRMMGHLDLLHNHLYFSVRAIGIRVFSGSIKLMGNRIYLTTGNGKEKAINKKKEVSLKVIAPATDEEAIASYISPYLPHFTIKKLNLYTQVGKSDDAFFSAITLGIIKCLMLSGFGVLRAKFPKINLDYEFETLYNIDHLQLTFNCILNMSIADIIYAVYKSIEYHKLMTKKGEIKNGRKKRLQQRASD